jgi:hypothetical protein
MIEIHAAAMRRAAPNVSTPAVVTNHHHFDPRLAAIIGSKIIAKGSNQEKGPMFSNTGIITVTESGNSINCHMKTMHVTPIHPPILA